MYLFELFVISELIY